MALFVGDHTYFAEKPKLLENLTNVYIGKFCSIAQNITFDQGAQHRHDFVSQYPFNKIFPECYHLIGHPKSFGDITIGNDCWICNNAFILSGVKIGNGAVIACNAVVSSDVKDYEIVGGVPSRSIKFRFPQDKIDILQRIKWWDWPEQYIKKFANVLMSDDVYELERIYNTYIK